MVVLVFWIAGISASYGKFERLGANVEFQRDPVGQRAALDALLADHNTQLDSRIEKPNALCLHVEGYGTRSSSMIFMRAGTPEISSAYSGVNFSSDSRKS